MNHSPKRKKTLLVLIPALIVVVGAIWLMRPADRIQDSFLIDVREGQFKISVTTTGELEAKRSENIYGPSGLREVRIWRVNIEDIIPEGTVVDSGAYVASLDRAEITNKLKDEENELEKLESQYIKTKLDTTMELRNARDELVNMKFTLEEKKIELEQSKYEPPATIRQVEISLDKSQRAYEQAMENYKLRLEKAQANMQEVTASLDQARRKYQNIIDVVDQFSIYAPQAGMVIYKRNWDGSKQGVGATISAWDNIVATLPDLSTMISKTFVNEIDISKVKSGQPVEVGVDAFPEKQFSGKVIEVANIGEQMRNSNAKVFEVKIEINEYDSILRPAMTTKNIIITEVIDSVLYIPLECVHNTDSNTYVYLKNGRFVKQEIEVGPSNENEIVVEKGLQKGDQVSLVPPEGNESLKLNRLNKN